MTGDESVKRGDELKRLTLEMNASFMQEAYLLKTCIHRSCELYIDCVHWYCTCVLHAIAFSAGLSSIQVDQVNREGINSRAIIPDKYRRQYILS